MAKKVLLGMSGGVDSSVSAVLLKEAGYDVIGATMKLWNGEDECLNEKTCCTFSSAYDAKRVCDKLNIPHYTLNCTDGFKKYVVDDFINCYKCAKTPNPCIECNKYLKFNIFYQKAVELGCDYIATGHYAKIEFSSEYNQCVLKKSDAIDKDQSYFLYSINKNMLDKIIFPLEKYTDKKQIRDIATKNNLLVANKPDSQEVCFIPDNDYSSFVINNSDEKIVEGNIVNKDGIILGKHKGLIFYTVGQRKGLGISYKEPLYVIKLDNEKNELVVGTEDELYKNELYATDINYLIDSLRDKEIEVEAKIRYRSKPAKARVYPIENNKIKVVFEEPQRAITPGQSVVLYKNDIVVGGGKII